MKADTRRTTLHLACLLLIGCAEPAAPPRVAELPVLSDESVSPIEGNVLAVTLRFRSRNTDSVIVHFALAESSFDGAEAAPSVKPVSDSVAVPVFGLLPERRYIFRATAYGPGGRTTGTALSFTTGGLPSDLPRYTASGTDPSAGYVVFAAGRYGVVIDNAGRVVWYRRFDYGAGLSFAAQPNGHYVARPPTATPSMLDPWVEVDPSGSFVRTRGCADGLFPRPHDLIIDNAGGHWLLCDEVRTMDLRGVGGVDGAKVTGTVIQHLEKTGSLMFSWSPFDHFDITDGLLTDRTGPNVNWTHGNAFDFDRDGRLLVSFRNLSEITSIDTITGAVVWRMGGRRNQFSFTNVASAPFSGQHSVRAGAGGEIILLDNVGRPNESRAESYVVDEVTRTASLSADYGSMPPVVSPTGGSVQRLSGARTLVSFGAAGRVEEYDASGNVVWRLEGTPGYVFRAQRILSLYRPGVGTSR